MFAIAAPTEVLHMQPIISTISNSPTVLKRYRLLSTVLPELAARVLERLQPEKVLSSLPPGWSAELARAAIARKIPVIGVLKLPEYCSGKLQDPAGIDGEILRNTQELIYAGRGHLTHEAYQEQCCYMIEHSDVLLVLHNGRPGTISSLVRYAEQENKQVISLWSEFLNLTKEFN